MKFEIRRNKIVVSPENDQDVAFIEDTLGLKEDGASINLTRHEDNGEVVLITAERKHHVAPAKVPYDSERFIGAIKSYNADKGYGFIINENEEDVFFHISDFEEKGETPTKGMEVSYSKGESTFYTDGKSNGMKAVAIKYGSTMPNR